jgi:hypothetical protein
LVAAFRKGLRAKASIRTVVLADLDPADCFKSLHENSNACGEEVRAGESVGNIEEKVHFH